MYGIIISLFYLPCMPIIIHKAENLGHRDNFLDVSLLGQVLEVIK